MNQYPGYQPNISPGIEARYRRLTSSYTPAQAELLDALVCFLAITGARIVIVGDVDGCSVWRLRSECETLKETESRLAKIKRTRKSTINGHDPRRENPRDR